MITDLHDKLTALKHLKAGRPHAFIAQAMSVSLADVADLQEKWASPEGDFTYAVEELERQVAAAARKAVPTASAAPPTPARVVTSQPKWDGGPGPSAPVDRVAALLARADKLGDAPGTAPIRRAATRTRDAITALEQALDDNETRLRAEAAQAAEKARLKDKLDRLQRELAETKALLTPPKTKSTTAQGKTPPAEPGESKLIRAWAATAGLACPARGRVPAPVRDAYAKAHPGTTSIGAAA